MIGLRRAVVVLMLALVTTASVAQVKSIGTPLIRNYEREAFGGGLQTWMISQAEDGRMFYANNDGLLEFDGVHWTLHRVPNGSIIRSIYLDAGGRVYVGCFDDFGFFEKDREGQMTYHSLAGRLEEADAGFGEVWRIHPTKEGLVFQSFTQLMLLDGGDIRVFKAPGSFHFSYLVNDVLYVDDREKGLMAFRQGRFVALPGLGPLLGKQIWGIIPDGTNLLLATADEGLYVYDGLSVQPWQTETNQLLVRNQYYCGMRLRSGHLAFGTIQKGLIICNDEGKPLQWDSRDNGLQNNTILCMFQDRQANLWLGTDIGIDYVQVNSPLSLLSYEYGLSAGYAAVRHDDILYLGTNQGVFYLGWQAFLDGSRDFRLIDDTRGQVWCLRVIDGDLFCGHHNGAFLIRGGQARKVSDVQGNWTFVSSGAWPDRVLCGTYTGLLLLERKGGEWVEGSVVEGFHESCRTIIIDEPNTLWVSHGLKGVFRLELDAALSRVDRVSLYGAREGLPGNFGLFASTLKGRMAVASDQGFYRFEPGQDRFVQDDELNASIPNQGLSSFYEDEDGDIWCFSGNDLFVNRLQEDGSYRQITAPFRQVSGMLGGGFQNVRPIDGQHVFIGYEKGFYHYDPGFPKQYDVPFDVLISSVTAGRKYSRDLRTLFAGGHEGVPRIPFSSNDLHFFYAATDFEAPGQVEYATFMDGHDQLWTDWEARTDREFTRLREGEYVFRLKARNLYGTESESLEFRFVVAPPWSRSALAFIIYALLFGAGLYVAYLLLRRRVRIVRKRERQKQARLFEERQRDLEREALESEKELVRVRNEKLREEMLAKDKELANTTMQMIQQSKLLNELKQDLRKLDPSESSQSFHAQVRHIGRRIDREFHNKDQWKLFELHFENVHEEFLRKLKARFPDLTPTEIRMCTFLRMNISSKEIASLLNISTRGVEIARYRLRKKLDLSRDQNLVDFILSI